MSKKKHSSSEVAALIPEYWDLRASAVEDIIFFGKITIREMIRSWRYNTNSLSSQIKEVDGMRKFFEGKDAAAICEIAKQHEKPKFPCIGVRKNSWSKDPEPLDAASINRESDATTFNFCGWCKHTGGGSCRYNYHITTSCSIKTSAGMKDEERKFNTSCFLKKASNEVFDQIRKGLERNRQRLIKEKGETDNRIKLLLKLEKQAEKKPALPSERPHDWFNVDDVVICYVGKWDERLVPDQYATAKVIMGYRHHDGCVSVYYDQRIHNGDYLEGHGGGYGMSRPEVMHSWEFEYLLNHPDFANLWAKKGVSRHLEDYDADVFLLALSQEMMKRGIKDAEKVIDASRLEREKVKLGGLLKDTKIADQDIKENRQELLDKVEKRHERSSNTMKTKEFHIGDVLSIVTGRLVSPRHMEGLYDILNFMTGDNLFTHQLPRASEECKPFLLEQFPWLDSGEMQFALGELTLMLDTQSGKQEPDKLILGWLSKLTSGKYGVKCEEMLVVKPIPKKAHEVKNPITELTEMVGPDRVIVCGLEDRKGSDHGT